MKVLKVPCQHAPFHVDQLIRKRFLDLRIQQKLQTIQFFLVGVTYGIVQICSEYCLDFHIEINFLSVLSLSM